MDIILVPSDCTKLLQVKLPRPKDGVLQHFLYDEDNITLYEITKYHDQFRSWFLDNQLCKDGHMNILTKIDPLYIFIPQIIRFASQQFRTLDDICSTFASQSQEGAKRLDYALSPDIDWNQICDTQQIDNEMFVKFSQSKTLDWLMAKHEKTVEALNGDNIISGGGGLPSKATLNSYALDLIDLYLPPSLSDKFKDLVRNNKPASMAASAPVDNGSKKQTPTLGRTPSSGQSATNKPKTTTSKRTSDQSQITPNKMSITKFFCKTKGSS